MSHSSAITDSISRIMGAVNEYDIITSRAQQHVDATANVLRMARVLTGRKPVASEEAAWTLPRLDSELTALSPRPNARSSKRRTAADVRRWFRDAPLRPAYSAAAALRP